MRLERWFYTVPLRLRSLFRRRRVERELDEELQFHLEHLIAERVAAGLPAREARQAALRAMRGLEQRKQECRDTWHVRFFEQLLQDFRYALRTLRRTRALTAVAVASLALGIGANTAIFSVVDAVMLSLLPVHDPQRLMLLKWSARGFPERFLDDIEGDTLTDQGRMTGLVFSSADYERFGARNDVFSDTLAFSSNDDHVNLGLGGRAEDALVQAVSGNYFQALGVTPALGRAIVPSDDSPAAPAVAVVSHAFWQRKLGGDPAAAGKAIMIDGVPAVVVGVAPPEFFGLRPGTAPDLWLPLSVHVAQFLRHSDYNLRDPRVWWLGIVGRLKAGKTPAQALAQLAVLFDQGLHATHPPAAGDDGKRPVLELTPAKRGLDDLRQQFSTPLLLLAAMVGLVLLIACANVAGLLLARAAARQAEMAVRLSLGAARFRIVRQLLTESTLLALLGAAAGLLVARAASAALAALLASGRTPIHLTAQLDFRVLAFTAGVAVVSGMLFGLAPALRASRVEVRPLSQRSTTAGGRTGQGFLAGKLLVGGQVALALLLLVGAGLFLRTLERLLRVDIGFDRRQLVVFSVQPGLNGYKDDRLAGYYQELQRRLAANPGVRAVGFSALGPVGSGYSQGTAAMPGYTAPGKRVPFHRHRVDPGYFAALGLPPLAGRLIGPQDVRGAATVVVVNERLVREYFHRHNPLGHRFDMGSEPQNQAEIVGVVRDTKYNELRDEAPPTAYLSYLQAKHYPFSMTYEVRSAGEPGVVMRGIGRTALTLDPNVPVVGLRTENEVIDQTLFLERTFALLSTSFGLLALVLACVGLYGTIGYTVVRRTHEIGVRMALGARREAIVGMVLRETFGVVVGGIALGLPLAWLGARLLRSQLFGMSAHDPATLMLATAALVAATVIAGLVPARRASSVEPTVALRGE
jgi:predicted permease